MKRIIILAIFIEFVLVVSNTFAQTNGQNQGEIPDPIKVKTISQWLKSNAIILKSVEAGNGFSDLKPLKKILKDVRIVGIGEATHGASEFFKFKHRMVEFLVKEMNFNVVALEASYPACLKINEYVLYGKGDRAKALAGQGYWTWNTEEISALIEWIYQYNKTRPEAKRVKFVGFDMQIYGHAFENVASFFKRVSPDYLEKLKTEGLPERLPSNELQQKGNEEKTKLKTKINELINFLSSNQEKFISQTSKQEFDEALFSANILSQYVDMFTRQPFNQQNPDEGAVAKRDYYMSENIKRIFNSAGKNPRMVVLAHNSHISSNNLGVKMTAMGNYLRQAFSKDYYAIGVTFGEGAFQSINMDKDDSNKGLIEFKLGLAQEGFVDWYFAQPKLEDYFVDFRRSSKTPQIEEWLSTPNMMRSIGSGYSSNPKLDFGQYAEPTVLKKRFDGIVFIRKTTRAYSVLQKPN